METGEQTAMAVAVPVAGQEPAQAVQAQQAPAQSPEPAQAAAQAQAALAPEVPQAAEPVDPMDALIQQFDDQRLAQIAAGTAPVAAQAEGPAKQRGPVAREFIPDDKLTGQVNPDGSVTQMFYRLGVDGSMTPATRTYRTVAELAKAHARATIKIDEENIAIAQARREIETLKERYGPPPSPAEEASAAGYEPATEPYQPPSRPAPAGPKQSIRDILREQAKEAIHKRVKAGVEEECAQALAEDPEYQGKNPLQRRAAIQREAVLLVQQAKESEEVKQAIENEARRMEMEIQNQIARNKHMAEQALGPRDRQLIEQAQALTDRVCWQGFEVRDAGEDLALQAQNNNILAAALALDSYRLRKALPKMLADARLEGMKALKAEMEKTRTNRAIKPAGQPATAKEAELAEVARAAAASRVGAPTALRGVTPAEPAGFRFGPPDPDEEWKTEQRKAIQGGAWAKT